MHTRETDKQYNSKLEGNNENLSLPINTNKMGNFLPKLSLFNSTDFTESP